MADDQVQPSTDQPQAPAQSAPADSQPQSEPNTSAPQTSPSTEPAPSTSAALPFEDLTPVSKPNRPESPSPADSTQNPAPPVQSQPAQPEPNQPQTQPQPSPNFPIPPTVEPTINIEPIEVPKPETPIDPDLKIESPLTVEPTITDDSKTLSVDGQVKQKLKEEQDSRRQMANDARKKRKEENLNKIMQFVSQKKEITNDEVRDFLHVSQTTATDYLSELTNKGALKREGKGRATKYG